MGCASSKAVKATPPNPPNPGLIESKATPMERPSVSTAASSGKRQTTASAGFRNELRKIDANPFVTLHPYMWTVPDDDDESNRSRRAQEDLLYPAECLSKSLLFQGASLDSLMHLADRMVVQHVPAKQPIIQQGASVHLDDYMYLVQRGRVRITVEAAENKTYVQKDGAIFGELGVLYASDRNASVHALTDTSLLCLSRREFLRCLPSLPAAQNALFLRRLAILQGLSDNQVLQLTGMVRQRCYDGGELIIEHGTKAEDVFIVKRGNVVVTKPSGEGTGDTFLARMREGQLLGQRTVVTGQARTASCRAEGAVEVLSVSADLFGKLDNPILQWIIDCDAVTAVLRDSLGAHQLDRLLDTFTRQRVPPDHLLFSGGQAERVVYVVRQGELTGDVQQSDGYNWCGSVHGAVVGRTKSATSSVLLVCRLETSKLPDLSSLPEKYAAVDQADLHTVAHIGSGSIGDVDLVRSNSNGMLYCLKKVHLRDEGLPRKILLNEALIMREIDSDFCVKLFSVVHDREQVLLLMQWVPGGELYFHMDKHRTFTEPFARFYAACVVIGLAHMHDKNILYRDLKPENLLMDADGYVLLADFGFAKHGVEAMTFTVVGTAEYTAPEILSRQGHGAPADLWSLGILVYEMLCYETPFKSNGDDSWALYRSTVSGRFHMPRHLSPGCTQLINSLLQPDPHKRPTARELMKHPWFQDVDWHAMERKQVQAPIVPQLRSPTDTSYYSS